MTPIALTNEEIDHVFCYIDNYAPPKPVVTVAQDVAANDEGSNNWLWLLVLGLLFAVIVLSLGGVKRSLQSAVHEAEGKGPLLDASGWQRFKAWAWDHNLHELRESFHHRLGDFEALGCGLGDRRLWRRRGRSLQA